MSVLTLATAKEYLQITHTREDTALQILLDACEDVLAKWCGVRITSSTTETVTEDLDSDGGTCLWPTYRPVLSITSIYDLDSEETVAATDYEFCVDRIVAKDNGKWAQGFRRYRVVSTAGYSSTTYPAALKLAVMKMLYACYHGYQSGSRADPVVTEEIAAQVAGHRMLPCDVA